MSRCLLTLSLATFLGTSACAQEGEALNYLRFLSQRKGGQEVEVPTSRGKVRELEIDSSLKMKWDLEGLVDHALATRSSSKGVDTLLARLQTLHTGVRVLFEAQERQMALREQTLELFATADTGARGPIAGSVTRALTEVVRYAAVARAELEGHKAADPEMTARLQDAAVSIGQNDVEPLAAELSQAMFQTRDRLASKLAQAEDMVVTMSARVEPAFGKPIQLHLEGFDNVETGNPKEFARMGKVLDSRTKSELGAAQALVELVRNMRTEKLDARARGMFARAQATAAELGKELTVGLLETRTNRLLEALRTQPQKEYEEATSELRAIQSLLSPFAALEGLQQNSELEGLLALAGMLDRISKGLSKNLATLPKRIGALVPRLTALVAAQPNEHANDVLQCLEGISERMHDPGTAQRYQDWANEVSEVRSALALVGEVTFVAKDLVPRQLPDVMTEDGLDTSVDLRTLAGERHPGDHVVVEARVLFKPDAETEELITSGEQRFRVEAYGLYTETRSALIFVDPRGAAPDAGRWEPTPSLGYFWRYGIKNNPVWNQKIALGVGLSFAMLDFNKDQRFELGMAASVTAFKDLLWVGYGRNFQARSDYFYIGINPLAARSLFRR